ncbi:MAG: DotG/IcmE/VirB10 family type IV secretion system protein [Acidithiobacillus sp.]
MSDDTDELENQGQLPKKKKGFMGVTMHMTAGRWLMVGVGGLGMLTAFGALWLENRGTQVDAGAKVNVQANGGMQNAPGKSSPAYAAEVAAYNKKHAAEALSHNQSFVGIPVTGTTTMAMPPSDATPIDEQQQQQQQPAQAPIQEPQQQQQPQRPAADGSIAKEFGSIATAMKNQRAVNPGYYIPNYRVPESTAAFESVSNTGVAPGAVSASHKPAIRPGTIIYGVFENAMKSTMPGPVIGELVQGKYNGDRVIGSFTRASGSNHLLIRLRTLVLPSGKTVSIDGYAVSPRTTLPGMATNVNYHVLTRAASFLAAAFLAGVEGYGAAVSQQGTTMSSSLFGSVTSYPILTPAQTMDIAAGQAAQQLQPIQQDLANNVMEPDTVSVAKGTPFGLLVVSSGASASSAARNLAATKATFAPNTVQTAQPQGSGAALQPVGAYQQPPLAGGQPYAVVRQQPYAMAQPQFPTMR